MKREEEIEQQAFVYYESCSDEDIAKSKGFIEGAKWADETMIDKACEWLDKVNTDNYMDSGIFQMSELISDFRKAMKGK